MKNIKFKTIVMLIAFLFILKNGIYAQDNPYRNLCPHSATSSSTGGLEKFWAENQNRVKLAGKEILSQNSSCNDILSGYNPDKPLVLGFDYILIKSEKVPSMDAEGTLHYDKPFDASFLLRYKGDKEPLEKTWWFHEYNNPNKKIISYNQNLIDIYKKESDFRLSEREVVEADLISKTFVFAEYSGLLKNKSDFCFTNTLFLRNGLITDVSEYETLAKFFNGFTNKFDNTRNLDMADRVFVTTVKAKANKYVAIFKMENGKLQGELQLLTAMSKSNIVNALENSLSAIAPDGVVYLYGDNLFDLGKDITAVAARKNAILISRNTAIGKSFNKTERALNKLRDKKIDMTSISFLNGTPDNVDDISLQSFENSDLEILKTLRNSIDAKARGKSSTVISTKEQLLSELTSGTNDVLFIVAHCDQENIYFGSSKLSIKELSALPKRNNRDKERVAVLFSCLTGNLYEKQKPFFSFFKKNMQSFSEVLIEKNYFDLIISPPQVINGNEILNMMDQLDKHPVLELRQYLNNSLHNGEMYNIAQR